MVLALLVQGLNGLLISCEVGNLSLLLSSSFPPYCSSSFSSFSSSSSSFLLLRLLLLLLPLLFNAVVMVCFVGRQSSLSVSVVLHFLVLDFRCLIPVGLGCIGWQVWRKGV